MLPRTQKGIVQLGIIAILFLAGGLFAATKLASNKDLTFFNINEDAKAPSGKEACLAKGCPWEWKGNNCKKSESNCKKTQTTKKNKGFTISVVGSQSSYYLGETVYVQVRIKEPDGTEGTASEDFNVQATIIKKGSSIGSVNGKFSPNGFWEINFGQNSAITVGKDYQLYLTAYCLTVGGPCEQKYGEARYSEVKWKQNFIVYPWGNRNI